jgi:hypothetical protein
MQVFVFASCKEARVRAFTSDETGGNLPVEYAPWQRIKGGRLTHMGTCDPIGDAIETRGFFIVGTAQPGTGYARKPACTPLKANPDQSRSRQMQSRGVYD